MSQRRQLTASSTTITKSEFAEVEALIRWWVRNPVAANLLMLIIITAGWLGLRGIEKEAFPSVQPDIVQIEVIWPGASAKEVEQQVVQRVEEALKNVSNVYRVSSVSREGLGSLSVQTFPSVAVSYTHLRAHET